MVSCTIVRSLSLNLTVLAVKMGFWIEQMNPRISLVFLNFKKEQEIRKYHNNLSSSSMVPNVKLCFAAEGYIN